MDGVRRSMPGRCEFSPRSAASAGRAKSRAGPCGPERERSQGLIRESPGDAFSLRSQTDRKEPRPFLQVAPSSCQQRGSCWSVGCLCMERSRIEHALSKAVVNTVSPPSDLALDAIVAGIRVEDTRPTGVDIDVVWPAEPTSL